MSRERSGYLGSLAASTVMALGVSQAINYHSRGETVVEPIPGIPHISGPISMPDAAFEFSRLAHRASQIEGDPCTAFEDGRLVTTLSDVALGVEFINSGVLFIIRDENTCKDGDLKSPNAVVVTQETPDILEVTAVNDCGDDVVVKAKARIHDPHKKSIFEKLVERLMLGV